MIDDDIKKVKECRAAIDKHQADRINFKNDGDHTNSVNKYMKVLNDNGFANVSEFIIFNDTMEFEIYKDAVPISGECDGCEGLPVPECVRVYGQAKACSNSRPKVALDAIYRIAYKGKREGKSVTKDGKTRLICPEGHGFYVDESKRKPYKKWGL